jgi:predicted RNase H-like nuclease (RuvC/YqgF family)
MANEPESPAINVAALEKSIADANAEIARLSGENESLSRALDEFKSEFDTFKDAAENRISLLETGNENRDHQISALADALENQNGGDDHLRAWTRKVLETYHHDDRPPHVVGD